jgi:regulatory protein
MNKPQKKYLSKSEALIRIQRYCAYQERCHKEVRFKLVELGIYGQDLEEIMVSLIDGNFLNEERFSVTYARSKFRLKQWGRLRIKRELQSRDISEYCQKKALNEIDQEEYLQVLREVLEKRNTSRLNFESPNTDKHKRAQYAISRGFEQELVWDELNKEVNT